MTERFFLTHSVFIFFLVLTPDFCAVMKMKETKHHPQSATQQSQTPPQRAVSFFVSKTINSVLKSSRKIIFRVCEAANVKRQFKMFQMYSTMQRRQNELEKEQETTGHDRFYQERSR
jgi:PX domain-containing protein kinase-like protein